MKRYESELEQYGNKQVEENKQIDILLVKLEAFPTKQQLLEVKIKELHQTINELKGGSDNATYQNYMNKNTDLVSI